MLKVGLTGGIGSGKSTVAECFAAYGVPVIDTDVIARELTASGSPVLETIQAVFGDGVMLANGALDRSALRSRVFNDENERRQLEAILHPLIRQAVEQRLVALSTPYVLIVIPLLLETGNYREMLDRILVVDCPEALQIERVMARSGLKGEDVKSILDVQATREARRAIADDVIVNTASPEAICSEVATLHRRYLALAIAAQP